MERLDLEVGGEDSPPSSVPQAGLWRVDCTLSAWDEDGGTPAGVLAVRELVFSGFFGGLTWAFARWTRSSPGFHIGGLQLRQAPLKVKMGLKPSA